MNTRLLSVLLAFALAGCKGPGTEAYRVFVEEDGLLLPSVEAVIAFPAVPREQRS